MEVEAEAEVSRNSESANSVGDLVRSVGSVPSLSGGGGFDGAVVMTLRASSIIMRRIDKRIR